MTLRLRPARLDEPEVLGLVEALQQWYVEIYGGRDDDPLDPVDFVPPRGGFLVGEVDARPVAMGGWTLDGPRAKVRRMYVVPAARRHGHAGVLLAGLEAAAAQAGAASMALVTGRRQQAAVHFYRSRGYHAVAPGGFYAESPGAVHLAKDLRAVTDPTVGSTAGRPPAPDRSRTVGSTP